MIEKAVFCISNISKEFSANDIKDHCYSLGAKVLFCHEVSKVDNKSKAFKLAVREIDRDIMENDESWPLNCSIRSWKYKPLSSTDSDMETQAVDIHVNRNQVNSVNNSDNLLTSNVATEFEDQASTDLNPLHSDSGTSDINQLDGIRSMGPPASVVSSSQLLSSPRPAGPLSVDNNKDVSSISASAVAVDGSSSVPGNGYQGY